MVADYIKDLCRTCIDRSDNYLCIYDKVVPDNIPFYFIINDLCQLSIRMNDGFPEYICKDCFVKISEFVIFKRKSHDAKTNFISMNKSLSEEGTPWDPCVEEEVDIATNTITKEMNSSCSGLEAGTADMVEEIITMPFVVEYEEVVMEDGCGIEQNKKRTKKPSVGNVAVAAEGDAEERRQRLDMNGGAENEITAPKEMREEYSEISSPKKPRTSSVAQGYYRYLLEKERVQQNGRMEETHGNGHAASEANNNSVASSALSEKREEKDISTEGVQPMQTNCSVKVNKRSSSNTKANGGSKGKVDGVDEDGEMVRFEKFPVRGGNREEEGSVNSTCEDLELWNTTCNSPSDLVDDSQILASDFSDAVIVLDSEEGSGSGNLSCGISEVTVTLLNPSKISEFDDEIPVQDKASGKGKVTSGSSMPRDVVKVIKVLASEEVTLKGKSEAIVKSKFNEKRVQVCDVGPSGKVFHVEPTIVKLDDVHRLCHPNTRITKGGGVTKVDVVNGAPKQAVLFRVVNESIGGKSGEMGVSSPDSKGKGHSACTRMALRSKKGKDVSSINAESLADDSGDGNGDASGSTGVVAPVLGKITMGVDSGEKMEAADRSSLPTDDPTSPVNENTGAESPVTKRNTLPPKKRPVRYASGDCLSSGEINSMQIQQMDKRGNSGGEVTFDSEVMLLSTEGSPKTLKVGSFRGSACKQPRSTQNGGESDGGVSSGAKLLAIADRDEDTLLLAPAKEKNSQTPALAILLRKWNQEETSADVQGVTRGPLRTSTSCRVQSADTEGDMSPIATDEFRDMVRRRAKNVMLSCIEKTLYKLEQMEQGSEDTTVVSTSHDQGPLKREELLHACKYCGEEFERKGPLDVHMKVVHGGDDTWRCNVCGEEFMEAGALRRHSKWHRGGGVGTERLIHVLSAREEEEDDGQKKGKRPKKRGKKLKVHICVTCGRSFPGKLTLSIHNAEEHLKVPVYACTHCGRKFLRSEKKDFHESLCNARRLACLHCNKLYTAGSLAQHMLTHNGQKPFLCSVCGKRFSQKGDFKRHMKHFHLGEPPLRPFLCAYCPKAFTAQSKLVIHERVHTREKPYTCGDCGRSFAYLPSLRKHQENRELTCIPAIEQASKPYVCLICKKGWDAKYNLTKHIAWVHQMKRPELAYACDICPKKYYCRSQLVYHMRTHTNEKPYSCKHCDSRYMYGSLLKTHMRKEHPDMPSN